MHTNEDDSWEVAAQAALDIHRRKISAVRERVRRGTGPRRKVRPRTATSRSRSDARTRPYFGPSETMNKRRPRSASSTNRPLLLVPGISKVSNTTVNGISRAELEAWATLSQNARRPRESRPTVTFDRARPNSAEHHRHHSREGGTPDRGHTATPAVPRGIDLWGNDLHRCSREQLGSGHDFADGVAVGTSAEVAGAAWSKQHHQRAAHVSSAPLPSNGKRGSAFRGTADGGHKHRSCHDGPGYDVGGRRTLVRDHLDGCGMGRAEHDVGHQREKLHDRSDISVRLLREHAKKAMKEEKAFLRSLRAESKAKDDGEIEMIHRATQWARDLEKDVLYLPHRVGGKLHVLKIENGFAAARFDRGERRDGLRNLEENGRVFSVDFFLKGDHARLEKERYAALGGGVIGTKDGAAYKSGKEQPKGKRNTSSQKKVRDRPDAAETCRELHRLIRDTVGLVEVLTRQAIELEGQGWNRPLGGSWIAGRGKTGT